MDGADEELSRLRRKAEAALRRSDDGGELERSLERLLSRAEPGTDDALFAHRHLAEVRLEKNPWQAALHLRHVVRLQRHDDVVHALMGLAQALLGNYRAAVTAYRRALQIAPRNPWYHHNLGHLLDVALRQPVAAESHLRSAHRMEPDQHEITASLAHCLARLEQLEEARALADEAVRMAPGNRDHRALFEWIDNGARSGETPAVAGVRADSDSPRPVGSPAEAVVKLLEQGMLEAGFTDSEVAGAQALWDDFKQGREIRIVKPEVYAAALEYAIALLYDIDGVTQTSVARRYGVARKSVSNRYAEIRDALALRPGDPRY